MVYRVTIRKEVLIDADELPTGLSDELSEEDCEYIWEAVGGKT